MILHFATTRRSLTPGGLSARSSGPAGLLPSLRIAAASVALALCLSACGGGGNRPVAAPPPPAPPPPPPAAPPLEPYPSASPPVGYGAAEVSATAFLGQGRGPAGEVRITGVQRVESVQEPGRNALSLEYLGPNSYAFDFNGFGGPILRPQDRIGGSAPLDRFVREQDGYTDILQIAPPGAGIELTHTTFGNVISVWTPGNPGDSNALLTFFAAGSITPAGQMPTTGSGSYSGIADGLWVDGDVTYRLYGSPVSLTADFATGGVTTTLDLVGRGDPFGDFLNASTTRLGVFTGTGTIGALSSRFDGNFAPTGGWAGQFRGFFFGPAAREFGYTFRLNGGPDQTAFGAAVGRKR